MKKMNGKHSVCSSKIYKLDTDHTYTEESFEGLSHTSRLLFSCIRLFCISFLFYTFLSYMLQYLYFPSQVYLIRQLPFILNFIPK